MDNHVTHVGRSGTALESWIPGSWIGGSGFGSVDRAGGPVPFEVIGHRLGIRTQVRRVPRSPWASTIKAGFRTSVNPISRFRR
jgi:hypothetical protein